MTLFVCLAGATALGAEGANPHAGTWVLDAARSNGGASPLPRIETRVYASNIEGALTVVVEGVEADGMGFAYAATGDLNGRSYPVVSRDVGARTLGDTISWSRADANTVEMKVEKKGEVLNLTRHALSEDGRTLTVTETLSGESGKSSSVKVFSRQ